MKTLRSHGAILTLLGLAVSLSGFAGCKKQPPEPQAVNAPAAVQPPAVKEETLSDKMERAKNATDVLAAQAKEAMGEKWDNFTEATYEQRVALRAHLSQAATRIQAQSDALAPKRDALKANARAAYDAAVVKLDAARAALSTKLDRLNTATADTWKAVKDDAVDAWKRVQDAYRDVERAAKT